MCIALLFFFVAMCKDPGYLKNNGETILSLLEKYDSSSVCSDCVIFRPARSRHCQCCDRCVMKFDHHCPWVNNCIGAQNLGVFYCFLLSMDVHLVIALIVNLTYMVGYRSSMIYGSFVPSAAFGTAVVIFALCFMFLFGVTALFTIQTQNFLKNLTTNERFSKAMQQQLEAESDMSDTSSVMSAARLDRSNTRRNFSAMCCNLEDNLSRGSVADIRLSSYSRRNSSQAERYSLIKNDFDKKGAPEKELQTSFLE
jgi:hypothetical protein